MVMRTFTGKTRRHVQMPLIGPERRRARLWDRIMSPYTVARAFYLVPLSGTLLVGLGSPSSLTSRLIDSSSWGEGLVWALFALFGVACLDFLVNDLCPPRIEVAWLRKKRHILAGLTSTAYMLLAWVCAGATIRGGVVLVVYYVLIAVAYMLHALATALRFRDAFV